MPSPDLLPKGRSLQPVVAPPLDDVLTRARRRRARRAGLAGVLGAAVITAATLLTLAPRESSDSIKVVTPGSPGHSASPAPRGHAPSGVVPRKTPGPKTQASQDAAVSRQHAVAAKKRAAAAVSASRHRKHARTVAETETVGPAHRLTAYDATRPCDGTGPTAANGWCSYYDGATSGVAGHAVTLATAVCRLPGRGGGALVSDTGRQADFAVGPRGAPSVWTWSHGRTFGANGTTIKVPAGMCVEWFVSWQVVDDSGQPLAPGRYSLDARPTMQPDPGAASATAFNPTTFTVR